MNKAILVIDMPTHCAKCPVCEAWEAIPSLEEYYCNIKKKEVMDKFNRPDWCPLKPAPKKDEQCYLREYSVGHKRGWNDCVDYLMNEQE